MWAASAVSGHIRCKRIDWWACLTELKHAGVDLGINTNGCWVGIIKTAFPDELIAVWYPRFKQIELEWNFVLGGDCSVNDSE